MKYFLYFLLYIVFNFANAQLISKSASDELFIRNFYTEYIKANLRKDKDTKEIDDILKKYVSTEFISKIHKQKKEIDIFINSKTFEYSMLDFIEINRTGPRTNDFFIYTNPKNNKKRVKLRLIKVAGSIKIEMLENL